VKKLGTLRQTKQGFAQIQTCSMCSDINSVVAVAVDCAFVRSSLDPENFAKEQ
jgi:hypothetical protein